MSGCEFLCNVPFVHAEGISAYVADSVQEVMKLSLVRPTICFLQWAVSGVARNFCFIGKKGLWEENMCRRHLL